MKTEVYKKGPAQFDGCDKFLGFIVSETDGEISQGLAKRIHDYAVKSACAFGFDIVQTWEATVGTDDDDSFPSDRYYWVTWKNEKDGEITLAGILTKRGWPFIDHGFSISTH